MPVGSPVLVAAPSATDFFHRGSRSRERRRRLRQWPRGASKALEAMGKGCPWFRYQCPCPQMGAEVASSVSCVGFCHNTVALVRRGGKLIFPLPF